MSYTHPYVKMKYKPYEINQKPKKINTLLQMYNLFFNAYEYHSDPEKPYSVLPLTIISLIRENKVESHKLHVYNNNMLLSSPTNKL